MKSFKDNIDLPESLQIALKKMNFVETTPIQSEALPVLMEGKDLIACSETGSGKTAAFAIPMVKMLLEDESKSGLILVPTRELAQQINEFIDELTCNVKSFLVVLLVGGINIRKQFKKLQKKARIIVATPGRLIDHLNRRTVQIHKTGILVLDEGDRMIDMGFAPQLKQILSQLPKKRQTSFFAATIDEKVKKLAKQYLDQPQKIAIGNSKPVTKVKQNVKQVQVADKNEYILDELNAREGSVIIFLKTKYRTDHLMKHLKEYGFDVTQIHGGRTQGQRNKAIRDFKSGKVRILCATDVAARGIDIPHVKHVINFDLPMTDEDYVHRVGRTARNGAVGEALSFVTLQEHRDWNRIARKYQIAGAILPETKSKTRGRRKKSSSKEFHYSKGPRKRNAAGRGRYLKKSNKRRESRIGI